MSAPERIYLPTGSIAFHHTRKDGEHTEYVRADLYARLQEQVETLRKEREEVREAGQKFGYAWKVRAEAAEAERDRLMAELDRLKFIYGED